MDWSGVANWFKDNGATLANTAVNGVLSYLGMEQQNSNIDKQLEADKQAREENNAHNRQLWEDDNAYNSPAQQKARLESAGLNSDLMYGQGGISNTSNGSAAPSNPMDWSALANKRVFDMNPVDKFLDTQLKQAQINKLNSETGGQDIQNKILASDASFRDAWNEGQLDTMYSNIQLQGSQMELNGQQIKESQSRIMQINALVNQINVNTQQIHNAIKNDNARLDMEKLRNSAEIKKLQKECQLTDAQTTRLLNEWEYLVTQYEDAHSISLLHQGHLSIDNGQLTMEGKMKYGAYDSSLSAWENVLKFLNQLSSYASPFVRK